MKTSMGKITIFGVMEPKELKTRINAYKVLSGGLSPRVTVEGHFVSKEGFGMGEVYGAIVENIASRWVTVRHRGVTVNIDPMVPCCLADDVCWRFLDPSGMD